ncbi:MAG: metallophosphoesterase [Spirochaetaceae bacterium]|nr:metallophosphoesterase [Spirochaetaceae bacterium]
MKIEDAFSINRIDELKTALIEVYKRRNTPPDNSYSKLLEYTNSVLENENQSRRPADSNGLPGGIVCLKPDITTIIVPDLHGRIKFLLNLLAFTDQSGTSILQKLAFNQIQIVCVGDGFHSEYKTEERWKASYLEFVDGYRKSRNMDREMSNNFRLMEIVQLVKISFPENFHFLKGNHENIKNEKEKGNHIFRKFAFESMMVYEYVKKFYDKQFLDLYYQFEKNMPLLAIGKNFLVSHAEPKSFFNRSSVIEYRKNPHVVEGLTWTSDGAAENGSVEKMLKYYLSEKNISQSHFYFGGHRSIRKLYNLRARGKYVQFHNPAKFAIVLIEKGLEIDLERDIFELEDMVNKTISIRSLKSLKSLFS